MIERKQIFAECIRQPEWEHIWREGCSEFTVLDNGTFIVVYEDFAQQLGYQPEELMGKDILDFIGQDDQDLFRASIFPSHSSESLLVDHSFRMLRKDGSLASLKLYGMRKAYQNKMLLYITTFSMEFMPPEKEVGRVQEMEERFRSAFNFAAIGMALVAINGKFLEVNYSLCEILGFSEEELIQSDIHLVGYQEDLEEFLDFNTRLLIGEIPYYEMEKRWIHKTGRTVWGNLNATLVRDQFGKPLYFIMQLQDVTKRKEAEDLLRKSEKLSAVGQLAAGVAHEVRNPLTVLKGFAQVLQSMDSKHAQYYNLMLSEVERIEGIISEFLMMARPKETEFGLFHLHDIISSVVALMETKAIMSNIRISAQLDSEIEIIECDEGQLKQVMINIIQNAMEAMPNGGEISVNTLSIEKNRFILSISDQGCGIPEDRIPRLGEPFYSNKEKGTGLGLMICYQIIEKHRGSIHVKSKLNEGTTFEITLPITQDY